MCTVRLSPVGGREGGESRPWPLTAPSPDSLPPPPPHANVSHSEELLRVIANQPVVRLSVPADGFNEAAHGVAWAGRATVFPCSMGMGATWNSSLVG